MRLPPAAPPCATIYRRMERSVISSIPFRSTIRKASLAGHPAAGVRLKGWCRPVVRHSIAPPARNSGAANYGEGEIAVDYEMILVEKRDEVGVITLNRPKVLNALNSVLLKELRHILSSFSADDSIGAIIITGSEKAFAAGADIKEMQGLDFVDAYVGDFLGGWDEVAATRKPVIAAVSGFALGGGCELAMMCDFIIASDTAKFGQPEITLGVIPGMGGSQRLTRAVGKAKAMDLVLTGRMMDAAEAERAGLVSRIVPAADLMEVAVEAATRIASLSRASVLMAKESVNRSFEVPLAEGLRYERRAFQSLFATEDQKEGMAAFVEKRKPAFRNR
ncbi:enoyl-CoA hydratase [Agrobacterium tumefaciens]|nr:enoyl-CoA hydratase [Agrobacterium tumefaciens]